MTALILVILRLLAVSVPVLIAVALVVAAIRDKDSI